MDTREQQLAQCIDRHLAVTANAGSGKTRVLVQRFVNILLKASELPDTGEVKPSEIVAITFTRKAASEMLAKVVKQVEEKIADAKNRNELEKLRRLRESLTYARISTIHSFCSSILKEYPVEAGVLPNFSELGDSDMLALKKESITSVMEDWLGGADQIKKEQAEKVFSALGMYKTEEFLNNILNKPLLFGKIKKIYAEDLNSIKAKRDKFLNDNFLQKIPEIISALQNAVSSADLSALTLKKSKKIRSDIQDFILQSNKTMELFDSIFGKSNHIANIIAALESFKYAKNIVLTQKNEFRADYKKCIGGPELESASLILSSIPVLEALSEAYGHEEYENDMISISGILIEMAEDIISLINEEKDYLGALYFDDMMSLTQKLLHNPEICAKIKRKIKFLLVDEFQDTDDLQYDIISSLVPGLSERESELFGEKTNLFIVGDAKQSIYGFRNADVRVFNQARTDIRNANEKSINDNELSEALIVPDNAKNVLIKTIPEREQDKFGDLQLSSTFRLQPVIASFVNKTCSVIMNKKESDFDVDYSDFVCGRNIDKIADNQKLDDSRGKVTFLINEVAFDEEEDQETEYSLLRKYIQSLCHPDNPVLIEVNGEKRPVKYSDIAILARSRNGFKELCEEFRKQGLPYLQHSGGGFFNAPEIVDVASFLNFLYNRHDDIPFAAILRSPFFGVSDRDIYTFKEKEDGRSLWEKFNNYCNNNQALPYKISRAKDILTDLLTIAANLPISQLIQRILDKTGWYGIVSSLAGKAHIEANIDKLLAYAREFEKNGFKNFYDFVEELNFITENSVNESEAAVISDEDAINIMTIHASKGLEFPIVILFHTNALSGGNDYFFMDEELGLSFSAPVILNEKDITRFDTPSLLASKHKQKLTEKAEEKRILYVAMTRAMDRLVISANIKRKKDGDFGKAIEMFESILEGMNLSPQELIEQDAIAIEDTIEILQDNGVSEKSIQYDIEVIKQIESFEMTSESVSERQKVPLSLNGDISSSYINEYFSASKMTTFDSDPEEYIRRYLLGFPADTDNFFTEQSFSSEFKDDAILGSLAGTMIHSVMEQMRYWLGPDGKIKEEILDGTIESIISSGEKNIRPRLRERIRKECRNIVSTPLLRLYAQSVQNSQAEANLYLPSGSDFLNGMIDLLIQNPEGEWEIWDWKTNRADSDDIIENLYEHYKLQMTVYAYFAALQFPEQATIKARLLFTRRAKENVKDKDWTREYLWPRREALNFGKMIEKKIAKIRSYRF